jgi:hypothetical protein
MHTRQLCHAGWLAWQLLSLPPTLSLPHHPGTDRVKFFNLL